MDGFGASSRKAAGVGRRMRFNPVCVMIEKMPDRFPVSDWSDCERVLECAVNAAIQMRSVSSETQISPRSPANGSIAENIDTEFAANQFPLISDRLYIRPNLFI
jgi:hypothetical protein